MLSDQSKKHLKASIREKNQQDLNQKFPISPPGLGLLLASSLADFLLKQVRQSITFSVRAILQTLICTKFQKVQE